VDVLSINRHYLGVKYVDGKETIVFHQMRVVRDEHHATQIATNLTMMWSGKIDCVNWMTEQEYSDWKRAREKPWTKKVEL
jgi:hypothetical protein